MSYQVLARKYRPRTFHDVVGQDHAVRALVHALDAERLHHAYLFTGTRGVGKTTIARIFAKCLNCESGVSSRPCGTCTTCEEIGEGRFVDLIEVDAASKTRVDDTRELLDNVQYLPTRGRFKVYLIDEVHMLSASSFNALLKTLEEPPPHVKFLLATTDPKKVPITVLSRCLQFNLKNILPETIADHLATVLEDESVPFERPALDIIAAAAAGSMRDALSVTDQAIAFGGGRLDEASVAELLGTVRRDEVGALLRALADGDKAGLLRCAEELAQRNADFSDVLANLQRALHDIAVAQTLGADGADLADLTARLTPEAVQLYYQIALMGGRDLQFAPDPRVGFEMTLIRLLGFAPGGDADRALPEAAPTRSENAGAPATAQAEPARGAPAAAQDAAPPTSQAAEPGHASALAWHEIVEALAPGGVSAMILEHSLLRSRGEDRWEIVLDASHDTLLNDHQRDAIGALVSAYAGRLVHVHIETGALDGETPAARKRRLADERHRDAVDALEADANVQSLFREFDGRLDRVRSLAEKDG